MPTPTRRFLRRMSPLPKDLDRSDPLGRLIVRQTIIVLGGLIILAGGLVVVAWVNGRISDTLTGQSRTDELAGCRSTLVAELVTAPQAIALKALGTYGYKSDEYESAVADLQPERYKKLTRLALSDPDAFLAECDRVVGEGAGNVTPFKSCAEAKIAGLAPLRTTDLGWNPDLDRDHDGIACE